MFEAIDYAQYRWPGHGTGDDAGYQYVEAEYMLSGEYEWLAHDPTGFLLRGYLPRIAPAFSPLADLAPLLDLMEGPGVAVCLSQFGTPEMQSALRILLEAGAEAMAWLEAVGATFADLACRLGMPAFSGGMTKAPFDVIGDTFRGTRGIIRDRFQRPAQLQEALERLVPLCIEQGVAAGDASGCPLIFIPLHKGADGFLSDEDYRRYYWPTLKAVILGLIDDGLVPLLFAEGGYNQRLSVIADPEIPAGKAIWLFDATDMPAARRALEGRACIGGNVPGTLLDLGTPARGRGLRGAPRRRRRRRRRLHPQHRHRGRRGAARERRSTLRRRAEVRRSVASSRRHAEAVSAPSLRSTGGAPDPRPKRGLAFQAKVVHSTPFFRLRERLLLV